MLANLLSPVDTKTLHVALMFAAMFSLSTLCDRAAADRFGEWFDIEFVTIGDPGNPPDTTGAGSVDYVYRIGKHEISLDMIQKANALGGLGITYNTAWFQGLPNQPVTGVSWYGAATFVNWLNSSSGYPVAYKMTGVSAVEPWQRGEAGYNSANPLRNSLAHYFLPSDDEWYKAAYYDPRGVYFEFPTGCDCPPTAVLSGTAPCTAVYNLIYAYDEPAEITKAGGLSPYGTMAQGGNVFEWVETEFLGTFRPTRGGFLYGDAADMAATQRRNLELPEHNDLIFGFRVARIPEPSSLLLGVLGATGLLLRRRSAG